MKTFSIKSLLLTGILMILAGPVFAFGPANGFGDISVACNADGSAVTGDTTVCVQIAGASAPKALGAEFALNFITTNSSNQTIYHYSNAAGPLGNNSVPSWSATNGMIFTVGAGDLNVWTGIGNPASGINVSGKPVVLSFAALHSMDGYGRLTCQSMNIASGGGIQVMTPQTYYTDATASGCAAKAVGTPIPMSSPDSQEPFIDFASLLSASCSPGVLTTYNTTGGGTVTVVEVKNCDVNKVRMMGTTVGASDVGNATYNNIGPSSAVTRPLSAGGLTNAPSFFIPFQMAVSSTLVYTNPKTGVQEQPKFSREVVQSLFNNPLNIPTWNKIPGFDGNSQSVFLCMRLSGSGTKASFNSTVMKPIAEYPGPLYNTGANYAYNFTGGDMANCIKNPPAGYAAIGYINADSLPTYPSSLGVAGSFNGVVLEGVLPYNDPNYLDPKATIKDMLYPYFTQEHLLVRTAGDPAISLAQNDFITTFEAAAIDPNFLVPPAVNGIFNAGKFWVAPSDMCATRNNTDSSPHKMTLVTTGNGAACPIK